VVFLSRLETAIQKLLQPLIEIDAPACLHAYLLTPWCRVFLEKLTGLQLVKEFPAFHGTRKFVSALTSVRHLSLSWASPIQSIDALATGFKFLILILVALTFYSVNKVVFLEKYTRNWDLINLPQMFSSYRHRYHFTASMIRKLTNVWTVRYERV